MGRAADGAAAAAADGVAGPAAQLVTGWPAPAAAACPRAHLLAFARPPHTLGPRVPPPFRLQVAAYTSGRSRVSEYDCLLLRHILWQRPDEADRIYDWLLKWV